MLRWLLIPTTFCVLLHFTLCTAVFAQGCPFGEPENPFGNPANPFGSDNPFGGGNPFGGDNPFADDSPYVVPLQKKPAEVHAVTKLLAPEAKPGPCEGRGPYCKISRGVPFRQPHPEDAHVLATLRRKVLIQHIETPLGRVVDDLRKATGVNIHIDQAALDGVGIGNDTPVTINLKDLMLKSALNLMLRQMELVFFVKKGVLIITTPEEAEGMIGRIYRIDDLVKSRQKRLVHREDEAKINAEKVMASVVSSADPASWNDVGGPGIAKLSWLNDHCLLTIYQTWEAHEEVCDVLITLRTAVASPLEGRCKPCEEAIAANSRPDAAKSPDVPQLDGASDKTKTQPTRHRLCIYPLDEENRRDAADFARAAALVLRPGEKAEGAGGAIIVRGSEASHTRVLELLRTFKVLQPGRLE